LNGKIEKVSLNSIIVEELLQEIKSGTLKPGDKLQSEKLLCERFGVGRHAVREALRKLEQMALVKTETGKGTFVCEAAPDTFGQQLFSLILLEDSNLITLVEFRMAIEMAAAELAAERITEAQVKAMKECIYDMQEAIMTGNREQYFDSNVRFHAALVSAVHNRFFEVNYASLQELIMFSQKKSQPLPFGAALAQHCETHISILEAIRSGNRDEARERVRSHLQVLMDNLASLPA